MNGFIAHIPAGWRRILATALLFELFILLCFAGPAWPNSVSVSGDMTASGLNAARAPMYSYDTITFSDTSRITNFDAWVDLSSGKIVIIDNRQTTFENVGSNRLWAGSLEMSTGACFVNNHSDLILPRISLGDRSVVYINTELNNAAVGAGLTVEALPGVENAVFYLSGSAPIDITALFTLADNTNNTLEISGLGVKTFEAGINIGVGNTIEVTKDAWGSANNYYIDGESHIYGTAKIEAGVDSLNAINLVNGAQITVHSGGSIITTGVSSEGIVGAGNNTVDISGTISTSGVSAYAVSLSGTGNTITMRNGGQLSTTANNAYGIRAWGTTSDTSVTGNVGTADNTILIEQGATISTTGTSSTEDQASAIRADNNSSITIAGDVSTTGTAQSSSYGAFGINSGVNHEFTITNTGAISTEGDHSDGITNSGYSIFTIAGEITTLGTDAHGISSGTKNTVTLSGNISTTGAASQGIMMGSTNTVTIENSGSITTNGVASSALYYSGIDNTVTIKNGASLTTNTVGTHPTNRAYGIYLTGDGALTATTAGLAGGGNLADGASNILEIQNGATIKTHAEGAYGILTTNNNSKVTVNGLIHTYGVNAQGIIGNSNNAYTLGATGSIITEGADAHAIYAHDNYNLIITNGSILTKGDGSSGIYTNALDDRGFNTVIDANGGITTEGDGAHGAYLAGPKSLLTARGDISTSGNGAHAIYAENTLNAAHISSAIEATGVSSYSVASGLNDTSSESNTFHILNGASFVGGFHNLDADNNGTSYLTFGYAKDADGKANLASVDNAFNFNLSESITSDSTGRWDAYFAGNTTTLSGASNTFRNMFVGAASFDNTAVPDGMGGTQNLAPINNATATLNVTQAINTNGTITLGTGSTYNLSGTHTHAGGGDVTIAGTFNLTGAGAINLGASTTLLSGAITNNSSAYLTLPTLDLAGDAIIGGSNTVSVTNAIELDHNLTFNGTNSINLGTVNVIANKSITDSDNTALTGISALNIGAGITGTLAGTGGISVNNANIDGALVFSGTGTKMIYGTGTLSGTITNNATPAIISTLDLDGDATINGTGKVTVNNALELDNNLTLNGTNEIALTTVNVTADKTITDSDNTALTNITNLNVNVGTTGTLDGTGQMAVTNANIDGALTLVGAEKAITNLTLAGTLTNNAALMTITTLDLDGNSSLAGSQTIRITNQVVLDYDLTLSNSAGVLFSNGLDTSAGGTLVNNSVITSNGVVLIANGDTYTITGEHNFAGGSFTSSPTTGTLELAGVNAFGGIFNTTNATAVNIAKLDVNATKFGTISGDTAVSITNDMNVAGTLYNTNTAGITSSGAVNITGTYDVRTKHTHTGSGDFNVTGTVNLSGILDIDGTGTNTIATLDLDADSTLDGDGDITVNTVTLDYDLALAGTGDTTLNTVTISAGKIFTNNSSAGTQTIATLDIAGDDAQLGGSGDTNVTNAVDIDYNFILSGAGTKNFQTVNLNTAGKSITDNGTGSTNIATLNVTANTSLNNTDATSAMAVASASVTSGDTLTLGGAGGYTFGALAMSGGMVNNSTTTVTTFTQNADLIIEGTGTTTIANAQTISTHTLTLNGTGNTIFQGGMTIADGKKLTNNANATLASLTVANAHTATIEGTGVTTITSLANIDNGATLVNTGEIATAYTGTLGALYELNGTHTQTAGTLTVCNLDVTGNNAEIGGDGTVIIANALTIDNSLTLSGSGTRNFTGNVTIADGNTLTVNDAGTNSFSTLDVASGETGTIAGTGTLTLNNATNIAGTLTNNASISTAHDFTVSTYNLGGTHTQTAGDFNAASLQLTSDDSELINNGATVFSGNTSIINNLALGGDGIKSFEGDVAVATGKSLTMDGDGAKTIAGQLGLADGSSLVNNGSGAATINALSLLPGATGSIEGSAPTIVTGITTAALGTELVLNGTGAKTLADLDLGGTLTNNSTATITDLDLTSAASIGGTGATTITNQLSLDNNLTLLDSGTKNFANGINMLAGTSLINNGTGIASLASLVIDSGAVTLDGSGTTNVTGTSAIDAGETLNITGSGNITLADVDLSGILAVGAGATGTTTISNLDFFNGGELANNSGGSVILETLGISSGVNAAISGTADTQVQNANIAGTLTKTGTGDFVVSGPNVAITGANGFMDMTAAGSGNLNIANGAAMTISSTYDAAGRGALDLNGDLNLTGTLNVASNSAVTTSGGINTQPGSIYNLSGKHTHTGTGDIAIAGKLDLAGGGHFENNATGGVQTIADLSVSNGSGTLAGNTAINVTAANINGTLNFAAQADSTFTTTNLAGTLNQSSANNLTLTHLNISSGNTGTLSGAGTGMLTATNGTIAQGGTLVLARDILIGNTLQNNGILAVSTGHDVTITGNYKQNANGAFQVNVRSVTEYTKLRVNGDADLTGSKGLRVVVSTDNTLANNDVLNNVLVADALRAEGLAVSDNSAMWDFESIVSGNSISLRSKRVLTLTDVIQHSSVSNSLAMGAAGALEDIFQGSPSADMQTVFNELGAMQTEEEIADAITQTLPLFAGSMGTIGVGLATSGPTQVVDTRLNGFSGLSSGDVIMDNYTLWAKPFYSHTEQAKKDGVDGYSATSFGLAIGGEMDIIKNIRLGAAFSYGHGILQGENSVTDQKVHSDTWQVTAYAENKLPKNFDLNLITAVGLNNHSSSRDIRFGSLQRTANASFNSWHAIIDAEFLRSFAITNSLTMAPTLEARYVYVGVDSYTETGAGDLSLKVDSSSADSLIASVGGKARYVITESHELSCFANVGYDFLAKQSSLSAAYTGGGPVFKTYGSTPDKSVFKGGLGYKYITSAGPEISFNYQLEARHTSTSHVATMSFEIPF